MFCMSLFIWALILPGALSGSVVFDSPFLIVGSPTCGSTIVAVDVGTDGAASTTDELISVDGAASVRIGSQATGPFVPCASVANITCDVAAALAKHFAANPTFTTFYLSITSAAPIGWTTMSFSASASGYDTAHTTANISVLPTCTATATGTADQYVELVPPAVVTHETCSPVVVLEVSFGVEAGAGNTSGGEYVRVGAQDVASGTGVRVSEGGAGGTFSACTLDGMTNEYVCAVSGPYAEAPQSTSVWLEFEPVGASGGENVSVSVSAGADGYQRVALVVNVEVQETCTASSTHTGTIAGALEYVPPADVTTTACSPVVVLEVSFGVEAGAGNTSGGEYVRVGAQDVASGTGVRVSEGGAGGTFSACTLDGMTNEYVCAVSGPYAEAPQSTSVWLEFEPVGASGGENVSVSVSAGADGYQRVALVVNVEVQETCTATRSSSRFAVLDVLAVTVNVSDCGTVTVVARISAPEANTAGGAVSFSSANISGVASPRLLPFVGGPGAACSLVGDRFVCDLASVSVAGFAAHPAATDVVVVFEPSGIPGDVLGVTFTADAPDHVGVSFSVNASTPPPCTSTPTAMEVRCAPQYDIFTTSGGIRVRPSMKCDLMATSAQVKKWHCYTFGSFCA
eukprot:TRINITY_DN3367_c0_g1_i2.p1 TRINITY_DN3367_c0_g1~~TRINITY_DN3367_c0_g1_i2.p1  ORF type:complete len:628 (-),score=147.98 TRINITY_DN3367_c0_g1_i2:255-2138(-)